MIEVYNSNGNLVLTENLEIFNLTLSGSLSFQYLPVSANPYYAVLFLEDSYNIPLMLYRLTSGTGKIWESKGIIDSGERFYWFNSTNQSSSMEYYLFDRLKISRTTPSTNYGLVLYNSIGEITFSSSDSAMLIIVGFGASVTGLSSSKKYAAVIDGVYKGTFTDPTHGTLQTSEVLEFTPTSVEVKRVYVKVEPPVGFGLPTFSYVTPTVPDNNPIIGKAIVADVTNITASSSGATFTITPSTSSVNEGSSVTFNISSNNYGSGTLYWTTDGTVNSSDFTTPISGSVTITNDTGSIIRTLTNDSTTEGTEQFVIELRADSTSGPVLATSAPITTVNDTSVPPASPTYSIVPNISSVDEGNSVTFTVSTTNVSNGTVLYWTTTGTNINSGDFTTAITGSVTINNGTATIVRTLTNDLTTEGTEAFALQLRTGSISGTIVATSTNVTINDTSTTPTPTYSASATTPVNEGSSSTCAVTTTNVANGTTLYWTILNGTTQNADFSTTSGSFTVNSNSGSFSIPIVADLTTEGNQTFSVQIRTGSTSGTVVATSNPVTINDTSTTPAGDVTPNAVNWNNIFGFDEASNNSQTISGITQNITLRFDIETFTFATITATIGGTPTTIFDQDTISVSNNTSIFFTVRAEFGNADGTITVVNTSDNNTPLDSFTYSVNSSGGGGLAP